MNRDQRGPMVRNKARALWFGGIAVAIAGSAGLVGVSTVGSDSAGSRVLAEKVATSPTVSNVVSGNNGCGSGNGGPSGSKSCSNPGHPVEVVGKVVGTLTPGNYDTGLRVSVTNPNNQDVQLTQVHAWIGDIVPSDCQKVWFTLNDYLGPPLTIKKQATQTVDLTFHMNDETQSQDACKSANIPVFFTATAQG